MPINHMLKFSGKMNRFLSFSIEESFYVFLNIESSLGLKVKGE